MSPLITLDNLSVMDMGKIGMLPDLPLTGLRFATTSTVMMDIPDRRMFADTPLEHGKIYVSTLTIEELQYAWELNATFPGFTLADYSVLYHARREQSLLITFNRALAEAAMIMGIDVFGYEWIIETLITEGVMTRKAADDRYRKPLMASAGRYAGVKHTGSPVFDPFKKLTA